MSRSADRRERRGKRARLAGALLVSALGCGGPATPPAAVPVSVSPSQSPAPPAQGSAGILLEDVTDASGVDFVHGPGTPGTRWLPEAVAGSVALFDYDGDERVDLLLLGGEIASPAGAPPGHTSRLYRNLGGFRFRDVSAEAGVIHHGLAMGVAVADVDEDGDADLYLTRVGRNLLLRNRGDGTFEDATESAGVAGVGEVGAGAAFLDADGDGLLDLLAAGYVVFDPEHAPRRSIDGVAVFPSPLDHDPAAIVFFRNLGDGAFVAEDAGLAGLRGKGMGVIAADHDDDGDPDVAVMNDEMANFLLENDGHGRFTERGVETGLAYDGDGRPQGNMGIDAADVDGDGRLDFHTTTFSSESPTLYRNLGGSFDDATSATRAGAGLAAHIKWGDAFADFDDDGLPDLYVANGDFNEGVERWAPATRLAVPNALLRNVGGRFENVSATAGPGLAVVACSRGVAVDDVDGDGRVDVVVANWRDRPTLLRNSSAPLHAPPRGWLGVRLVGTRGNRDAVGARVRVEAGGRVGTAEVHAGRGYQGHYGTRLHFGLGDAHAADRVEVRWPGGTTEVLEHVAADRVVTIREGSASGGAGQAPSTSSQPQR